MATIISPTFLHPSKVHVFPFGNVRSTDSNARVLNEQNLTTLVKKLTDKSNYVISYDSNSKIAEFVIQGYYFKADLTQFLARDIDSSTEGQQSPQDVYAYAPIELIEHAVTPTAEASIEPVSPPKYYYLTGADNTSAEQQANHYFNGLRLIHYNPCDGEYEFENTEIPNPNYCLHVLTYDTTSSSWKVPDESLLKYSLTSIESTEEYSSRFTNLQQQLDMMDVFGSSPALLISDLPIEDVLTDGMVDLNKIKLTGKYHLPRSNELVNIKNLPTTLINGLTSRLTGTNFVLYVIERTSTPPTKRTYQQLILTLNGKVFTRGTNQEGEWQSWVELANDAHVVHLLNKNVNLTFETVETTTTDGIVTETNDSLTSTTTINGDGVTVSHEDDSTVITKNKIETTGDIEATTFIPGNDTVDEPFAGNAASASKLKTARTIALTGDVSGSVVFDGTTNVELDTNIEDLVSENYGTVTTVTALNTKIKTTFNSMPNNSLQVAYAFLSNEKVSQPPFYGGGIHLLISKTDNSAKAGTVFAIAYGNRSLYKCRIYNQSNAVTLSDWEYLIEVDEVLSNTSNRPLQNKVIVDKFVQKVRHISNGTDFNNVVDSGFYRIDGNAGVSFTNAFDNPTAGQLIVSRGSDTAAQIGFDWNNNRMYHRTGNRIERDVNGDGKDDRSFRSWKRVVTTSDVASDSSYGVIKTHGTSETAQTINDTNRNYGVNLNTDGKAFVNVPWTEKYHTTGTWGGTDNLTYTATAVGSADTLEFTLPTASSSAYGVVKDIYMTKNNPIGSGYLRMGTYVDEEFGENSVAFGTFATSVGNTSFAVGDGVIAKGDYSTAIGISNDYVMDEVKDLSKTELIDYWQSLVFGGGSIKGFTMSYGDASFAGGTDCLAIGDNSFSYGWNNLVGQYDGVALGRECFVQAPYGHASGYRCKVTREGGHAEGKDCIAGFDYSRGEEYYGTAPSHAEGSTTWARGSFSHSEGVNVSAFGEAAHAEGYSTQKIPESIIAADLGVTTSITDILPTWKTTKFSLAYGTAAHVEGRDCLALNRHAHAEGFETIAEGEGSHAGGIGTRATVSGQTVIGKYNKENDDALFIVGNGSGDSESNRTNAFEVLDNGRINATSFNGYTIAKSVPSDAVFTDSLVTQTYSSKKEACSLLFTDTQFTAGMNKTATTYCNDKLLVYPDKGRIHCDSIICDSIYASNIINDSSWTEHEFYQKDSHYNYLTLYSGLYEFEFYSTTSRKDELGDDISVSYVSRVIFNVGADSFGAPDITISSRFSFPNYEGKDGRGVAELFLCAEQQEADKDKYDISVVNSKLERVDFSTAHYRLLDSYPKG